MSLLFLLRNSKSNHFVIKKKARTNDVDLRKTEEITPKINHKTAKSQYVKTESDGQFLCDNEFFRDEVTRDDKIIDFNGMKIIPIEFTTKILKRIKIPENYKEVEDLWLMIEGKKNKRKEDAQKGILGLNSGFMLMFQEIGMLTTIQAVIRFKICTGQESISK